MPNQLFIFSRKYFNVNSFCHCYRCLILFEGTVFTKLPGKSRGVARIFGGGGGGARGGAEALIVFVLLKVQSLQLSFRPAGVSLGGGGGQGPLRPPPLATPLKSYMGDALWDLHFVCLCELINWWFINTDNYVPYRGENLAKMSSQSGWLKYVDSMIQYSSGGMTCGCIIGRDGSLWTPPGAKVTN